MTLADEVMKTPTKKLLILLLVLKLRLQKALELIDSWQLEKGLTKMLTRLDKNADPLPHNTKQYQFILTQYHQVPASIALY